MKERTSNENGGQIKPSDWLKIVIMPIVLLILTAVFANVIGVRLQDRSFRKNEVFRARLAAIETARQEATNIQKDVERARRQIRQNETDISKELENTRRTGTPDELAEDVKDYCSGDSMAQSLAVLREALVRANALLDTAKTKGGQDAVNDAVVIFNTKILAYIECVDSKDCRLCNSEGQDLGKEVLDSLTRLVAVQTKARETLIEEYN